MRCDGYIEVSRGNGLTECIQLMEYWSDPIDYHECDHLLDVTPALIRRTCFLDYKHDLWVLEEHVLSRGLNNKTPLYHLTSIKWFYKAAGSLQYVTAPEVIGVTIFEDLDYDTYDLCHMCPEGGTTCETCKKAAKLHSIFT